jgi:hypothetical protein
LEYARTSSVVTAATILSRIPEGGTSFQQYQEMVWQISG